MARQFDWYTGQLVAQQDMDAAFQNLEDADHDLMVDTGFVGIVSGFVAAQHVGTPNLTIDVTAGVAYSPDGERIVSAAALNVNCAYDYLSNATAVQNSGKSKILGIYLLFDRLPSDPRTDAANQTVYFVQDETMVVEVVQGAEATVPSAPAAPAGGVLICHVTLTYGQTSILNASISTTSRDDQIVITGASLSGRWGRTKEALQGFADFLNGFVAGNATTIHATSVTYAGSPAWADFSATPSGTVEATFDWLATYLGGSTVGASGDIKIGVAQDTGAATTLPGGALASRLQALRNASTTVYLGSPAFADATTLGVSSVEAAIDAFVTKLAGSTAAGAMGFAGVGNFSSGTIYGGFNQLTFTAGNDDGAKRIGTQPFGNFAGATVRAQINELTLTTANDDGAKRVGAEVKGGFTAGNNTTRKQLDDLDGRMIAKTMFSYAYTTRGGSITSVSGISGWTSSAITATANGLKTGQKVSVQATFGISGTPLGAYYLRLVANSTSIDGSEIDAEVTKQIAIQGVYTIPSDGNYTFAVQYTNPATGGAAMTLVGSASLIATVL